MPEDKKPATILDFAKEQWDSVDTSRNPRGIRPEVDDCEFVRGAIPHAD